MVLGAGQVWDLASAIPPKVMTKSNFSYDLPT